MSEFEQTEEPRRIVEIDPNEVSVVDHPAIERRFLVIKSLEKQDMPREEISLEEDDAAEEAEAEKDAEEQEVAQDASEAPVEEEEQENAEADPEKLMEAAAALLPWLRSQMQSAEGELRGQLSAFLEALGQDTEPEAEEAKAEDSDEEDEDMKEEEEEKSEGGWQQQLEAVNETLSANVSKASEEDEEADDAEKSEEEEADADSEFVTTKQFEAFASGVTDALTNIATSMAQVSKSVATVEAFTPVSKAAEDVAPVTDEVSKGDTDAALFGSFFGRKR